MKVYSRKIQITDYSPSGNCLDHLNMEDSIEVEQIRETDRQCNDDQINRHRKLTVALELRLDYFLEDHQNRYQNGGQYQCVHVSMLDVVVDLFPALPIEGDTNMFSREVKERKRITY